MNFSELENGHIDKHNRQQSALPKMVVFAACAVGGSLLLAPMFMLFISIIFMASLGKSLGVRRFYVALLLKVFEVSVDCRVEFRVESVAHLAFEYIR